MLSNSFSYLPVFFDGAWRIISDVSVAKFLGMDSETNNRKCQLSKILEDAIKENKELLNNAVEVPPTLGRAAALKKMKPDGNTDKSTNVLLVTEPSQESLGKKDSEKSRLVGILTAFDLL
jgi:hypothetical protein